MQASLLFLLLEVLSRRAGRPMRNIADAKHCATVRFQVAGEDHSRAGHDFVFLDGRVVAVARDRLRVAGHLLALGGDDSDDGLTTALASPDVHSSCSPFSSCGCSRWAFFTSISSRAFCFASRRPARQKP